MPSAMLSPERLENEGKIQNQSPVGWFLGLAKDIVNVPTAEVDLQRKKYEANNALRNRSESIKNGRTGS
jgi:hypothetical protein